MKNKSILIGYLLAFVTLFFLSFHGVGGRFLTTNEGLNPMLVVFIRFLGGVIILSFFLLFFSSKKDYALLFKSEKKLYKNKNFWLSSIFFFLTLIAFNFGTQLTSASNVVLIQSLAPIIVLIITVIYFPLQSSNYNFRKIFFIAIIASIGSSLLVSDNSLLEEGSKNKFLGDLISFFAMIFFAFFNFFYVELRKDFNKANGLIITTSFLMIGLILSMPSIFLYYEQLEIISDIALFFIILISFGSTGIAYFTWFLAGRYLSAITLILIFNIVGVTTMIVEFLFYGETKNEITYKLYFGAILIITSIYYIQYLNSKINHSTKIDKKS